MSQVYSIIQASLKVSFTLYIFDNTTVHKYYTNFNYKSISL